MTRVSIDEVNKLTLEFLEELNSLFDKYQVHFEYDSDYYEGIYNLTLYLGGPGYAISQLPGPLRDALRIDLDTAHPDRDDFLNALQQRRAVTRPFT